MSGQKLSKSIGASAGLIEADDIVVIGFSLGGGGHLGLFGGGRRDVVVVGDVDCLGLGVDLRLIGRTLSRLGRHFEFNLNVVIVVYGVGGASGVVGG